MPYIKPEIVAEAKRMDLYTYLKNYEPHELVKISKDKYCTKTHDSLKISNGMWMWWSRGIGGKTALEYLIKVRGMSFLNAVETIMGYGVVEPEQHYEKAENKKRSILLPKRSPTTDKITSYLLSRGIDQDIINYFVKEGLIYESIPYHNLVFLGFNQNKEISYASYRATNSSRIMGECSGSKKEDSFRYVAGITPCVHLFESAIDLMSYATLIKMQQENWRDMNLISLAGVYSPKKNIEESKVPKALDGYLEHATVNKIILHLDNDKPGRNASKALMYQLSKRYQVVDCPPPSGKDFNDFLCNKKGILKQEKERGRDEYR